jgi:opacity protein-like surface antigen
MKKILLILLLTSSSCVFAESGAIWEGFYGGIGIGLANQKINLNSYGIDGGVHNTWQTYNPPFSGPALGDLYVFNKFNSTKIIPDLQFGYNWRHDKFIYGLEADFKYLNTSSDTCHSFSNANHLAYGATLNTCNDDWGNSFFSVSTKWLSTINGKIGYTFDAYNLSLQGGLAFGEINSTLQTICGSGGCGFGSSYQVNSNLKWSELKYGWNLGAEIERKVNDNWALFAKYKYVDLGSVSHSFNPNADYWPGNENGFSSKASYNILNFGANYYF